MTIDEEMPFELRRYGGSLAGPHLVITAGVHGDEYLAMLAVKKIIERFESEQALSASLRGSLTLIPIANRLAFRLGHRVAEDGKDLARTCPGRLSGTVTERIAYALSQQILKADYYVDLHTGGTELCVYPLAGYVLHPDRAIRDTQRDMARAFQLPLVWGTSAELEGRTLSVARDAAIPAIYVEYLGAHRELAELAGGAMKQTTEDHPMIAGCMNLMRHLQMFDEPAKMGVDQQVIEDPSAGSGHLQVCNPAPLTGWLHPRVSLGQAVAPGDLLAEIVAEGTDKTHRVLSSQTGIIIVVREYPRIVQGDTVAVIAEGMEPS